MKLKRILSAVLASAVMTAGMALSAFAVEDGQAAYCFDTGAALSDWQTYGSVSETGFRFTQTTAASKNGSGSLLISETVTEDAEDMFGGAYIDASALGLDSFKGCTVEMSVLLCKDAQGLYDNFSVYSDGIAWISTYAGQLSSEEWTTLTLVIPENAENTRVGFTIPTFKRCVGDILYIDDFSVTDANGSLIANKGDYEMKKITEAETVSQGTNIFLTAALVVLILVIVGGIGLVVSSVIKKFS